MKFNQHIYTNSEKGWSTIAATQDIKQEEQMKLEDHSKYTLPHSLLFKEDYPRPIKYIFYPLDEKRFVLGRAIYTGRDNIKRPGNYLFHNFIISKEEMINLHLNPIRLIRWLEHKGLFRDKIPDEPLNIIEFTDDEIKMSLRETKINNIIAPHNLILNLLYCCFNYESIKKPLLLIGKEKEYLDFVGYLYELLPYNLRERFSFDTYSYGTNLTLQMMGIPDEDEFQQTIPYFLKLNLVTQQYITALETEEPSKLISFIAKEASEGRIDELNLMYSVGLCLQKGDYVGFKEGYNTISPQIKEFIYTSYKKIILNYIVTEKDRELLQMVRDMIVAEDIALFSSDTEMIYLLLESKDKRILEMLVDWFCTKTNRELFYPLLFKCYNLWIIFLEKIKFYPNYTILLFEALKVFSKYYSEEFEEPLMEKILKMLSEIKKNKRISRDFAQALDNLGASDSEKTILLRTFIKYELTGNQVLLKKMMISDGIFSMEHQMLILNSILKGIIKTERPKEIFQQLHLLFDRAKDKYEFMLKLLGSIERIEISDKTKQILKETVGEFLKKLPKDETTDNIKSRIEMFFQQKPSFIERLLGKKGNYRKDIIGDENVKKFFL